MKSLTSGHIKAGLDSFRGAKMRNFWTMFGVIMGVASVISVVAIGEGIKAQVSGQIHHLGKNLITVRPAQLRSGGAASGIGLLSNFAINSALTDQDTTTIAHTKGVAASAPLSIVSGTIRGDHGPDTKGFVIGTTSELPSLLNQSLAYGAFLNEATSSNVAVLGQDAADALFNEDVPLGRSFSFHGQQFIVIGIFNQFNDTPLSQQADFNQAIFIPNATAEKLTNNTAPTYEILAKPTSASQTSVVAQRIRRRLDASHGGQSNLSVLLGNQNLSDGENILNLLTSLIAGAAAISLLVGGIGIMDVMLVSVAERMHEIGIRKAVGATNRQILSQFMTESTVLSLTGGVIGIALAYAVDLGLHTFTNLQPQISWQVVALASGVSLLVGVVFGSIPAFKAARKNPIEALRSD